jgi:protein O-mannosyl-transferase
MVSAQAAPEDRTPWVALAALAAFGGSLFSAFHFDDYGMLQDPAIVSPEGWWRCWALLQTRPLTWFTFWLNYQIGGREPLLWHAVNLGLHAACSVVLYRVLRRLAPRAALLGALIFAVHPMQAEAVDYIYARAILLSTFFSLLALSDWTLDRPLDRPGRSVVWFVLAILSKEESAGVPLVLALYSLWRGELRQRILPLATMLGISLLAGLRVIAAIQVTGMKNIGAHAGISPLGYLSEQGIAILRYCGLLVFPWFFTVDAQIPRPELLWRVLAWLVLLGLLTAATLRFREVKAAFWILAGFILLIPSSSIFPAADLAADRRMYLPMLAFAPAMALLITVARPRLAWVFVFLLAALAMGRTFVWSSDERLWGEAVHLAPEKVRPRIQLSRAVAPERAVEILREAGRLAPQDAEVPTELARVYLELHRPGEALAEAGRALALSPNEPHALNNRGVVLLAMHQPKAARGDFLAALRTDPCLTEARDNLARSGGVPADAPRCAALRQE